MEQSEQSASTETLQEEVDGEATEPAKNTARRQRSFGSSFFLLGSTGRRAAALRRSASQMSLDVGGSGHGDVTERYDVVFFFGDLNYRINGNRRCVDALIGSQMAEVMLHNDQLNRARAAQEVLAGFDEAEIHFAPTYKYDRGRDVYDTSDKVRIPSYTDRILFRERRVKTQREHETEAAGGRVMNRSTTIREEGESDEEGAKWIEMEPESVSVTGSFEDEFVEDLKVKHTTQA